MTISQPEFLPGTLVMIIVRSLLAGPLHGFAVAKRINQASKDALATEEGSRLNRMLVKGCQAALARRCRDCSAGPPPCQPAHS